MTFLKINKTKTARMHKLISKTVLLPPFWNALVLLTYDQALYNGHKLKITKSSKENLFLSQSNLTILFVFRLFIMSPLT